MSSVDPRELRNAFGEFTTGVTLVTTVGADGKAIGMTANSFSSVSLDPPMILWCIDKGSDRLGTFEASDHFAVNVLASNHQDLSNRFAKKGEPYMDGVPHEIWETGCPVIADAVAVFDCDVAARHDAGDHIVYVGLVRRFGRSGNEAGPLVFHQGGYKSVS